MQRSKRESGRRKRDLEREGVRGKVEKVRKREREKVRERERERGREGERKRERENEQNVSAEKQKELDMKPANTFFFYSFFC